MLLAIVSPPLYSANVCPCPEPPGGQITCEDHQGAACKVNKGKVNGECKTPPKSASQGIELRAWFLSELLKKPIQPSDVAANSELQQILKEGRYTDPKTGEIVTFRLPKER